jgi:hypothetical protein
MLNVSENKAGCSRDIRLSRVSLVNVNARTDVFICNFPLARLSNNAQRESRAEPVSGTEIPTPKVLLQLTVV